LPSVGPLGSFPTPDRYRSDRDRIKVTVRVAHDPVLARIG
jgi:hypothetical protein